MGWFKEMIDHPVLICNANCRYLFNKNTLHMSILFALQLCAIFNEINHKS